MSFLSLTIRFVPARTCIFLKRLILLLAGALAVVTCAAIQSEALAAPAVKEPEPPRRDSSDRIVVTASRIAAEESSVASAITVIGREEIERRSGVTVAELLAGAPGVHVARAGGPGAVASVFLRGTGAGHTLVMIDGVVVNDPMSPSRSFDFSNLSSDHIERIEIVRGSQSVLYGSDAMGGVIHVITRKGAGPLGASIEGSYGSYSTYDSRASLRGGDSRLHYSVGVGARGTRGFSAAKAPDGDPDGQDQLSVSARAGGEPLQDIQTHLTARYSDSAFESDRYGGPAGDALDFTGTERTWTTGAEARYTRFDLWEPVISFSLLGMRRSSLDEPPGGAPEQRSEWRFDGARADVSVLNHFYLGDEHRVVGGWLHRVESGESVENEKGVTSGMRNRSMVVDAFFSEYVFDSGAIFSSAGVRHDRFDSGIGAATTFRFAPGWRLGESTVLRAGAGSGFKAPTLYQLHSGFGNPELEPERGLSWDLSVERRFGSGWVARAGVFRQDFRQLIDFDFSTNRFANLGRARSEGVELEIRGRVGAKWDAGLTYTYTRATNLNDGSVLLRRPAHQLRVEGAYRSRNGYVGVNARYAARRFDLDPASFERMRMPDFAVVGLDAGYDLTSITRVFGRIENLLDADYEEVAGFATPGRSFFVGVRQTL